MAIITFWNNGKVETGQSMTLAAIATTLAINYDYKILMINTKFNDKSLKNAFESKNNINNLFTRGKTDFDVGLSGVAKAIISNKTSPEIITNYTKIIFKNLELLTDENINRTDFEKYIEYIKEIIKLANRYYDLVFVDLEGDIENLDIKQILQFSNINVVTMVQNINVIDNFLEEKAQNDVLKEDKTIISINKYDEKSKYTVKNVAKYIKEKKVFKIPYNTTFSMDAPEGKMADYFIKFKRINSSHINFEFTDSVYKESEEIIKTVKEQQRKIY